MKILRHGVIHKYICPECKCLFVLSSEEAKQAPLIYVKEFYTCPECGCDEARHIEKGAKNGQNCGAGTFSEPD